MRYILIFFLISLKCFPQDNNISVISAEKVNIVYRSIANPIKIAVPGAKSFSATAPGLTKIDENGNYTLSPGAGTEVKVIVAAVMEDGNTIIEGKVFRILQIPGVFITINGDSCGSCIYAVTKEQLLNMEIGYVIPDVYFIEPGKAVGFDIKITGFENISVEGSKMNEKAKMAIRKSKVGDSIVISELRTGILGNCTSCIFKTYSTVLRIIE